MSDAPPISLDFGRQFCARHGEPFRANWPGGAPFFVVYAIDKIIQQGDPVLTKAAEEAGGADSDPKEVIERFLDEKPLCCRLMPEDLLSAYLEAYKNSRRFGRLARCRLCSQRAPGAPYSYRAVARPGAPTVQLKHLCFRCVCQQVRGIPLTDAAAINGTEPSDRRSPWQWLRDLLGRLLGGGS